MAPALPHHTFRPTTDPPDDDCPSPAQALTKVSYQNLSPDINHTQRRCHVVDSDVATKRRTTNSLLVVIGRSQVDGGRLTRWRKTLRWVDDETGRPCQATTMQLQHGNAMDRHIRRRTTNTTMTDNTEDPHNGARRRQSTNTTTTTIREQQRGTNAHHPWTATSAHGQDHHSNDNGRRAPTTSTPQIR